MENKVSQIWEEQKQKKSIFNILQQRYLPYWPILLFSTILGYTSVYFYLKTTVPIYLVTANIELHNENSQNSVLDALGVFGGSKTVDNEIDILKSRTLMLSVVNSQKLYATQNLISTYRNFELFGEKAPLEVTALDSSFQLASSDPIEVNINWNSSSYNLNKIKHQFGDTIIIGNSPFIININQTFISTHKNYKETFKEPFLLQIFNQSSLVSSFISSLNIEPSSKQSTILILSVETPTPAKGSLILSTLLKNYQEANINNKNLTAQNTLKFIDSRLKVILTDINNTENNIKNFKTNTGVASISEQGGIFLNQILESDKEIGKIDLQLSILNDIELYIKGKGSNPGAVPSLLGINDPMLGQLLSKLYEKEEEYHRLEISTNEKNDQFNLAKDQVKKIKSGIFEIINNIKGNLNITKNTLATKQASSKLNLLALPDDEQRLINITREATIQNSIYSFLLQKKEETSIANSSTVSDSRIIDDAYVYPSPIKPRSILLYQIGTIIGLTIGLLFVFVREDLSGKILFLTELQERLKFPVIGEIGFVKSKENIVVGESRRDASAEQFRLLRTNLSFYKQTNSNNIIMLTSSLPGEGKTFVAINLAITMTLLKKRVLVIELDLRKPRVTKYLSLKSNTGLTDYLIGNANIEEIIQPVSEFNDLFLIPAGVIPPNPTELILTDKFKNFISEVSKKFDHVIIDTPPFSLVSDAQVLSQYAGLVLYVIRHGVTPRNYLGYLNKLEDEKILINCAYIFNGIKSRGITSGYGYGGGYGYGYGYGYDSGKGYGYGENSKS